MGIYAAACGRGPINALCAVVLFVAASFMAGYYRQIVQLHHQKRMDQDYQGALPEAAIGLSDDAATRPYPTTGTAAVVPPKPLPEPTAAIDAAQADSSSLYMLPPVHACGAPRALRVGPRWLHATCVLVPPKASSPPKGINAITGEAVDHHPIFASFLPWAGKVALDQVLIDEHLAALHLDQHPEHAKELLVVDFLGFRVPRSMYCNKAYMSQPVAHAIRHRVCAVYDELFAGPWVGGQLQTAWPLVAEEYFEYADVLQAVKDYTTEMGADQSARNRPFTFIELGAGYGHWTFAAHSALQQLAPGAQHRYLLVDVLDSLRPAIDRLARLNRVTEQSLTFHTGYVTAGTTGPLTADAASFGQKMIEDYGELWAVGTDGQSIKPAADSASLQALLSRYDIPCPIDMVDIDIQSGEYGDFYGRPGLFDKAGTTADLLTSRVKRVHIGLHGNMAKDSQLLGQFESRGWRREWYFPKKPPAGRKTPVTAYGPVEFADGVLSYINVVGPTCGGGA